MSGAEKPMSDPRPMASLTASLLARRGGARPAMRRAPLAGLNGQGAINDDLGWNDMGEQGAEETSGAPDTAEPTPILEQLSALAGRIRETALEERSSRTRKPRPATLSGAKHKAAFTLRLDGPRHLRLRLLSAVSKRSAQQLLVEALDDILARQERVQALAEQIEADRDTSTRA